MVVGATYRFLLLKPHPLLILQEQGVPALFHVQVSATHFDKTLQDKLFRWIMTKVVTVD